MVWLLLECCYLPAYLDYIRHIHIIYVLYLQNYLQSAKEIINNLNVNT